MDNYNNHNQNTNIITNAYNCNHRIHRNNIGNNKDDNNNMDCNKNNNIYHNNMNDNHHNNYACIRVHLYV